MHTHTFEHFGQIFGLRAEWGEISRFHITSEKTRLEWDDFSSYSNRGFSLHHTRQTRLGSRNFQYKSNWPYFTSEVRWDVSVSYDKWENEVSRLLVYIMMNLIRDKFSHFVRENSYLRIKSGKYLKSLQQIRPFYRWLASYVYDRPRSRFRSKFLFSKQFSRELFSLCKIWILTSARSVRSQ